jgi:hypothetical protein
MKMSAIFALGAIVGAFAVYAIATVLGVTVGFLLRGLFT